MMDGGGGGALASGDDAVPCSAVCEARERGSTCKRTARDSLVVVSSEVTDRVGELFRWRLDWCFVSASVRMNRPL